MSGHKAGTISALYDAGVRYVAKVAGRVLDANGDDAASATSQPNVRHGARAERGVIAETAPIVCAVFFAMALGVGSGLWINAGLASPPSEDTSLTKHSQQGENALEHATLAPSAMPESQSDDSHLTSHEADEADADEPSSAHMSDTRFDEESGAASRAVGGEAKTRRARDEDSSGKISAAAGRASIGRAEMAVGRAQGRVGPCTLSTDTRALTIASGGSASITLRLNGATGAASINAATPNWADIVVFAGAQTSANGASVRWYTVRSVSKRAGLYRVSFSTPCGSKTIPVTVTQQ